jgi:quercetin dioxygenase-like cupin family protein
MQIFFDKDEAFLQSPAHLKHLIDASPGLRNGFFALGDATDEKTAGIVMLQLEPGHVLERHAHDCFRFEVVVAGTLYAGDKVLGPGDVMIAMPGEHYGPHTAGPEGVTTCEVFSSFSTSFQPLFESPDGTVRKYDFLAGDVPGEEVWEHNRKNAPTGAVE